jgi:hypothetical protein
VKSTILTGGQAVYINAGDPAPRLWQLGATVQQGLSENGDLERAIDL